MKHLPLCTAAHNLFTSQMKLQHFSAWSLLLEIFVWIKISDRFNIFWICFKTKPKQIYRCFNRIFFFTFVSPLFLNFNRQLNKSFSRDFSQFNEYGLFISILVFRGILRRCWRGREKSMASHLWPSRFWRKPTLVVASVWPPPSWQLATTPFCSASRSDPLRCLIRIISMNYIYILLSFSLPSMFSKNGFWRFFSLVLNFTFRFLVFVAYYFFNLLTHYLLFWFPGTLLHYLLAIIHSLYWKLWCVNIHTDSTVYGMLISWWIQYTQNINWHTNVAWPIVFLCNSARFTDIW